MQQSLRGRLWSRMINWATSWFGTHHQVMTEVVEIIEEAPRATPEMAHMVETGTFLFQEIDAAYEASRPRPSRSSDRPTPYTCGKAGAAQSQTFG